MTQESLRESLSKKLGADNLKKIESVRVGIAGAGGLGSNCALNLVRAGFKKLTIVDFDKVSAANLDRQFYFSDQIGMLKVDALKANLLRVNPDLELEMINAKLDRTNIKSLFASCRLVVECLDLAELKKTLSEELLKDGKVIVAASGVGGIGASDDIRVHRIKENFMIIGDLESDIGSSPALSPRVNVASAKQADAALEYVLKNF